MAYTLVNEQWLVAFIIAIPSTIAIWNLLYYVNQTNRDLAGFFKSIQYNDFTTTTSGGHKGPTFKELHDSLNMINQKFQDIRAEKETNHQFLYSIVEHVDIGLLGYNQNQEVILMNKALQRLLRKSYLVKFTDLETLNEQLWESVKDMKPGSRELVKLNIEDKLQQVAIQCTELKLKDDFYRLLSFQNIQNELEEQELIAWQKLIRILTHEIMNSVAPISSLSSTLSNIMEQDTDVDIQQIKRSLKVINKRSEGLLSFTETYRTLTRIPPPRFQSVNGNLMLEEIATLFESESNEKNITLEVALPPQIIHFQADPALFEQVLINLVRNALDAVDGSTEPKVKLHLKKSGSKVSIVVVDNGIGISEETMEQVFVPFFTTKEHGSGIGLSLSRQIVRLHKGTMELQSKEGEGTVISITI
ncbi:MAG: HAMP domain-containing histidine kinase [Chitinophagales bacterium]|nr:HAMP domain-containing histidine kinase [Chitinophagales bacterium]